MRPYVDLLREKLSKISINMIFYNNKLVFLFSVLASFAIWIGINSSGTDSAPIVISDIPVNVNLSESAIQDGLRVFSGHNIKAKVSISGNKLIVGQVSKDDILITAQQATTIASPGSYTLELVAKKTGILSDYEFVSGVEPAFIPVMVDRYREAEFTVEPEIEFSANPDYFLGATVLSSPKVVLSGPESEISKIKRITAKGTINQELQSTYTAKVPIVMYDAYGEQIISESVSSTVNEVDVTIPVLTRKKLSVHPNFINAPEGLDLSSGIIKVTPSSLEIAGTEEQINTMEKIELESINFQDINIQHNKFNMQINLPTGCRSLNNIYNVEVSIDMSGFRERSFLVDQISFVNTPEEKTVKSYTNEIEVKIVGPSYKIKYLNDSNVEAEVDLQDKNDLIGAMEIPVKIVIKNCKDTWASGEYLVNIEIS